LAVGQRVVIDSGPPDHGRFVGTVTEIVREGNVAIVTPDAPELRAWFTNGYDIGRAHWDTVTRLDN